MGKMFLRDCTMPAPFSWVPAFNTDDGAGGGGGSSEGGDGSGEGAAAPKLNQHGYPDKTSPNDMQPEHAAAYWRHKARMNEDSARTAKAELADLKPKADQFAALEAASKTEAERAVEQARREAREQAVRETEAAARTKYGSALVGAEFRVHLAGRLSAEQIGTLVDGLDVGRFMTDDGQPDGERIAAYVAAIPAATTAPAAPVGPLVTASQGVRPAAKASGLSEGASLFADRHKGKASTT